MTKTTRSNLSVCGLVVALGLAAYGCDDAGDATDGPLPPVDALPEAEGYAQKGPFAPGSSVELVALEAGSPQGEPITTETGPYGELELGEVPFSGPALLSVHGPFFDEATGEFAEQPVTLAAVVYVDEAHGVESNVNVLTHFLHEYAMAALARREPEGEAPQDILADVLDDYRDLTGLTADPGRLNFLANHEDLRYQQDSAMLLALSVAVSRHPDVPALLDDLAHAWDPDAGELSSEGEETWSTLLEETGALHEDLEAYLEALEAHYAGLTASRPVDDWSRIGIFNPCVVRAVDSPDHNLDMTEVCLYRQTSRQVGGDSTKYFAFQAPDEGAYYLSVSADPLIASNLYVTGDHTDVSRVSSSQDCLDACALGGDILSKGSYMVVSVTNQSDGSGTIDVTPRRFNQGSPESPMWIDPSRAEPASLVGNTFQQFAGTTRLVDMEDAGGVRAPNNSYYQFLLHEGTTLYVESSPCEDAINENDLRIRLFSRSPSAVDWTATSNSDGLYADVRADECELEIDTPATGGHFTMQVTSYREAAYYLANGVGRRQLHIRAE